MVAQAGLLSKRLIFIGLTIVAAVTALFALKPLSAGEELPYGQGLLWKVEKPGVAPSYVYGTMHSSDPAIVKLPEPVAEAFGSSDTVILELLTGAQATLELAQALIITDGRVLPDIIGDAKFEQVTVTGERYGLPAAQLQLFRPWAVMSFFSLPPVELQRQSQGNLPLDQMLQADAKTAGKQLVGLESVTEQLSVFTDMTEADQIALLDVALDLNPQIETLFGDMKRAYLAGDLDGLHRMAEEQSAGADPRLAELFQERLVVERNQRMVERAAPTLDQGGAFMAIGALHLAGEDGILKLLEDQGFQVSRAY